MQTSLNGGGNDATADMQLHDMLALDDTSMADFDLPSDFDLSNFNDSITAGNNDPTASNPFQVKPKLNQAALPAGNNGVQQTDNDANDDDDDDDAHMTGVGAGPLPTGFGVSLPPNTGSTLTEFTKRRNWSQRVVEEIKDFLHILTPDGRLMYVSPSTQALTGYDPSDLVGKIMSNFVHPDDSGMFMREFHESIASGHPLRFFYRLRKPDQTYAIFEAHGHPHFSSDVTAGFGGNNSHGVSFCRGFFMMSRPYPSKNAALLDSFLEHKIENERLQKRISDLKREEVDDMQDQQMAASAPSSATGVDHKSALGGLTPSAAKTGRPSMSADSPGMVGSGPSSDYNAMPPPAKPPISNWALTQSNLEELSQSKPDSINDKMARYEGSNHLEGIEMMTGLRYRDGERSKGISTGAMSPTLVRGDQGIEYPADRDGRRGSIDRAREHNDSPSRAFGAGDSERKKKIKVADEYVCTDCGTLDSPEWRRGPNGPKTLCNACGLRWAKQEKKRVGTGSGNGNGSGNGKPTSGSGSGDSNRQSMAGNPATSPTTASLTPKAVLAGTNTNGATLPAMGNLPNNNSNMPLFQGSHGGNPAQVGPGGPPISVNISAAQAVQNMQGMGSPMSGLSPMSGMAGGNMLGSTGPGMPSVMGGGGGHGMHSMPFSPSHANMPGMFPQQQPQHQHQQPQQPQQPQQQQDMRRPS